MLMLYRQFDYDLIVGGECSVIICAWPGLPGHRTPLNWIWRWHKCSRQGKYLTAIRAHIPLILSSIFCCCVPCAVCCVRVTMAFMFHRIHDHHHSSNNLFALILWVLSLFDDYSDIKIHSNSFHVPLEASEHSFDTCCGCGTALCGYEASRAPCAHWRHRQGKWDLWLLYYIILCYFFFDALLSVDWVPWVAKGRHILCRVILCSLAFCYVQTYSSALLSNHCPV